MRTTGLLWSPDSGWSSDSFQLADEAQLILLFLCSPHETSHLQALDELQKAHPNAQLVGCSTAGQILDTNVHDNKITGVAIAFSSSHVCIATAPLQNADSAGCARQLADQLAGEKLKCLLVLSDGIHINGSDLVAGFREYLPEQVLVSGGLSADGERFQETFIYYNGEMHSHIVMGIGLSGPNLKVGHGSLGGWDPFGPVRTITRSEANVLHELDHASALDLYKQYLGDYSADLPASGLLFPLSITSHDSDTELVRTLLSVSESDKTMTFAGNLPVGARARFMKANFDRLVDGAQGAAEQTLEAIAGNNAELAILISCIGRKMVLGPRIEEEVEAVQQVLGTDTRLVGFYSYGEISPLTQGGCELHNQTMTITTLYEAADA